jgi:hypothetical protein
MRDQFARLLGFAAFMASEESGAPEQVRRLARAALPPGAEVIIKPDIGDREDDQSETVRIH